MLCVDKQTEQRLIALNQSFYDGFATTFSNSRAGTEPGLARVVAQISPHARVLDLGCGQARLAWLIPSTCTYVGVDSSREMLRIATEALPSTEEHLTSGSQEDPRMRMTLIARELVSDRWEAVLGGLFNWVVLRAVLHHVPGYRNRLDIVRRAAGVLVPGGRMVVANWQFLRIERLRRRVLPWSAIGLTNADVDVGDYLLDWRRDGVGFRYAHHIDEAETRQLATDAGLRISEEFYADGHTNDLTLYAVLE